MLYWFHTKLYILAKVLFVFSKNEIEFPVNNIMHIYTVTCMSLPTTQFYEILLSALDVLRKQTVSVVYLFLSSKGA